MKSLMKILGIGMLALSISGCNVSKAQDNRKEKKKAVYQKVELGKVQDNLPDYIGKPVVVQGIPLSTAYASRANGGHYSDSLAVVLDSEGVLQKRLLCYSQGYLHGRHAKAKALIDAEIADGDKEPITLKGVFGDGKNLDADVLYINSVIVGDYTVNINGYKEK